MVLLGAMFPKRLLLKACQAWRMKLIVDTLGFFPFFFLIVISAHRDRKWSWGGGAKKWRSRRSKSRHAWRKSSTLDLRVCLTAVTGSDPLVGSQQQSPIYSTDADTNTNGKINIHVSVVFVKSLSDLKKKRAQNRHISGGSLDANGNGIPMPVSSISNSDLSTDDLTQRFTGNTSEIVSDNHSEKSCCTVM